MKRSNRESQLPEIIARVWLYADPPQNSNYRDQGYSCLDDLTGRGRGAYIVLARRVRGMDRLQEAGH